MRVKLISERSITVTHFNELQTWSETVPLRFTVEIQIRLKLPTPMLFVHGKKKSLIMV